MENKLDIEPLIDRKAAAELLHTTVGTLDTWRHNRNHGIPYIKIGKSVRYSKPVLLRWLAEHSITTP